MFSRQDSTRITAKPQTAPLRGLSGVWRRGLLRLWRRVLSDGWRRGLWRPGPLLAFVVATLLAFAPGLWPAGHMHGTAGTAWAKSPSNARDPGIEPPGGPKPMEGLPGRNVSRTAEGGMGGQTFSFRGIDNSIYYMMEKDGKRYKNFTGCGNTVNGNHPVVRDFILHCLRYWVLELRVDGFRFDLATILARGRNGDLLANPPVIEQIAEDPVLRGVKIIAEAWDAAGAYQVGSFPSERWSEWNGKYRDDMRDFWRGKGNLSTFATRLCGSPDLYDRHGQTTVKTINYIACHDGFTLADIVSYNQKHNLANCEENRDGENHNRSDNCGHEGPTTDPAILARRRRRQKNLLATLFLSQGVPMLNAGDEFSRTQQGNNNAYCQDNELSWVDWSLLPKNRDLHQFVRELIAFRRAHPALLRTAFFKGKNVAGEFPDIRWYGPDGAPEPDWANGKAIACRIDGRRKHTGAERDDDHLFIIFNADTEAQDFELPPNESGDSWKLALTTQEKEMVRRGQGRPVVTVAGESLAVFLAR